MAVRKFTDRIPKDLKMKMKHFAAVLGAVIYLGGPAVVHAQASMPMDTASPMVSLTDGEIKRIDTDAGKLTIKHGQIKNLDMPGMTMVFVAKDGAKLASLKAGDKIRFLATNEGGKFFASEIQSAQ
jgi:Cu(I)/Ag(I) efflux system periplasmic protein CusF